MRLLLAILGIVFIVLGVVDLLTAHLIWAVLLLVIGIALLALAQRTRTTL